ncbi:3-oxoacyl-[acyl-carrier-protein] reductase [Colletotrichum higginsianum]|uniref:3-oxoacyl-[acyl-carrier-protein] reductase n=1 Tax=Colletotrichum higginsianum (strain IMI 349063) TaxID=759273 RepID=H1VRL1_COLHI|nr:3-oxoacyl-[acyl-carrier-protein] reductase [Colletotrichum higginsianum]CCF42867.1 3-oxoacyl-[acyl-carrier-protein] reductase [Colletotrichum higginsianum]
MGNPASESKTELSPLPQDLRGKTALVTGASRGIGRAIALQLARRGAVVVGTCSSTASLDQIQSLEQAVKQVYKPTDLEAPRIVGLAANLLDPQFPDLVANTIRDELGGKLNIIVNNAFYFENRPVGELDADFVQRMLVGNVQCLVLLTDRLLKDGHIQPESRVVNISTDLVRSPLAFEGAMLYASTKAAMESLTRSWADILAKDPRTLGTTVNALSVGATATDTFIGSTPPDMRDAALKALKDGKSVHGGLGLPEDVADVVGLLVSEGARWINGSVVAANGGAVKIL